METPNDCLVLMIEEIEDNSKEIDHVLFILYDTQIGKYVIRGKRSSTNAQNYEPYSFTCIHKRHVSDFIDTIICSHNQLTLALYNYDNLPYDSDDITFDFLKENVERSYELAAFDDIEYNDTYNIQKNMLSILKNVTNEY